MTRPAKEKKPMCRCPLPPCARRSAKRSCWILAASLAAKSVILTACLLGVGPAALVLLAACMLGAALGREHARAA